MRAVPCVVAGTDVTEQPCRLILPLSFLDPPQNQQKPLVSGNWWSHIHLWSGATEPSQ